MSGVAQDETTPTGTPDDGAPPMSAGTDPEVRDSKPAPELDVEATPVRPHLRLAVDNSDARVGDEGTPEPERTGLTAPAVDHGGRRSGALLRTVRENQGLSIEQVAAATRIRQDHLRAIEDMMPNLVGAKVYVEGHIRTYARHLGLNADEVLSQYRRECAILSDPEKLEIAPPPAPRNLRPSAPVLGLLVLALTGAGAAALLMNLPTGERTTAPAQATPVAAPTAPAATAPPLRIVALKQARIEIRGADGTKFIGRDFQPGETYAPRVGAGWTVSTDQGDAFEWRLGDTMTLGLFAPQGGPVNYQSVDMALQRQPVLMASAATAETTETPAASDPSAIAARPAQPRTVAADGTPVAGAAAPRRPAPRPAAAPAPTAEVQPAPAAPDPALAAYTDPPAVTPPPADPAPPPAPQ